MRLVLATRSEHKAREIRQILATAGELDVVSLAEIGVEHDPAEEGIEVYDTFQANAMAKARFFVQMLGKPVLADDSGLCVDALDGAPGVRTKRFSGRDDLDGQALDDANNAALLAALDGVPDERRGAHYVCVAVLHTPSGLSVSAVGTFTGRIGHEPRGSGGFGYDPIFELPERDVTVAELPAEEKNRLSHRARAFRALAPQIGKLLRS